MDITSHFSIRTIFHVQGMDISDDRISPAQDRHHAFNTGSINSLPSLRFAIHRDVERLPIPWSDRRKLRCYSTQALILQGADMISDMLNEFWPDTDASAFGIRILMVERAPLRCAPLLEYNCADSEYGDQVKPLVIGHLEIIEDVQTRSIVMMISELIKCLWKATKSSLSYRSLRQKNSRLIMGTTITRDYAVSFDEEIARRFGSSRAHIFHISPGRYQPRSLLALIRDIGSEKQVPGVGVAYDGPSTRTT